MGTFTRQSILLKWKLDGETAARAFYILREGYGGGDEAKPATYTRSLYNGSLLRVFGIAHRKVAGTILVQDSPSGSEDGAQIGSILELHAAHWATDLQCKSFEDSSYWAAEWQGDWTPVLDYDPIRGYAAVPILLEEV